ncbi:hypothetical protein N2152v2_009738 [Parachlorella kessleri]
MFLSLSAVFMCLVLFLLAEKSFVHVSRTARRVFWYLLSCAFGLSLVRVLQSLEGFSMVWVVLSAVLAASVVEDEVRKALGLTALEIDASKRLLAACHTPEAQGRAERLMDIVNAINRGQGYTAGTKQLLLRVSGTRRRLQRALHAVLEGAGGTELNYILCAVNAPALLEVASRHTLDLLCERRVAELATVSRAVLVDALQKLGLRYRSLRQLWCKSVLLSTKGLELTYLKAYLDDGGDYHTMYKLAYHDLQGSVQKEVLEHITREGHAVLADFELHQQHHLASAAPEPEPYTQWQLTQQAQRDGGAQPRDASGTLGVAGGGTQQQGGGKVGPDPGGAESGEGVWTAGAPAAQQGQHGCGRHSVGECPPGVVLKILSDIDDTLFCSGGAFPAGTDKRYPKKCFYPGALALYAELDRCFAKRHSATLRTLRAGVPPMHPRRLSRESPSRPVLPTVPSLDLPEDEDEEEEAGEEEGVSVMGDLDQGAEEEAQQAEQSGVGDPACGLAQQGGAGAQPQQQQQQQEDAQQQAACSGGGGLAAAGAGAAVAAGEATGGAAAAHLAGPGGGGEGSGDGAAQQAKVLNFEVQQVSAGRGGEVPVSPFLDLSSSAATAPRAAVAGQHGTGLEQAQHRCSQGHQPQQQQACRSHSAAAAAASRSSSDSSAGSSLSSTCRTGQRDLQPLRSSLSSSSTAGQQQDLHPSFSSSSRATQRLPTLTRRVLAELDVKGRHQEGSNLVLLSARPESYKGLTENEAYRKYFQPMVTRGILDTSPTMLLGSLDAGPRAIAKIVKHKLTAGLWAAASEAAPQTAATALFQTLAAKKLSRAREYAAIYPEACLVFIGDNGQDNGRVMRRVMLSIVCLVFIGDSGQGDVLCAEVLWSAMRQGVVAGADCPVPSRLVACLIHKVVPLGATYSMLLRPKGTKDSWRAAWEERDIYFNKTHVGMALQAYGMGLLDQEALSKVASSAASDFRRICARFAGRRSGKGLAKAWKQLSADIAAANACLPPHLQLPPLPGPPARRPSEQELLRGQRQAAGQQQQQQHYQRHQLSQELPEQLSVGNSSELQAGYSSGVGSGGLYSAHLRRPLSPAKSDAGWSDISGVTSTL